MGGHQSEKRSRIDERLYWFLVKLFRVLTYPFIEIRVTWEEELDLSEPCIIAPNHASVFDPLVLACAYPRCISFVAHSGVFRGKMLTWFFRRLGAVAVDRRQPQVSTLRRAADALRNRRPVVIFPEGKVNMEIRKDASCVMDVSHAKPGVIYLSRLCGVRVLPVAVAGTHRMSQGRLSPWRRVGIDVMFGRLMDVAPSGSRLEDNGFWLGELCDRISRLHATSGRRVHQP